MWRQSLLYIYINNAIAFWSRQILSSQLQSATGRYGQWRQRREIQLTGRYSLPFTGSTLQASLALCKCALQIKSVHTLSSRKGSTLARHSEGRMFAFHWLQEVSSFVARICTVQVELRGNCLRRVRCNGQLIGSTVSDAIVRIWLWSTSTGNSPLGYFSSITGSRWSTQGYCYLCISWLYH